MKDGHLNKCKECTRADVTANVEKNFSYYQKYESDRYKDPARKASMVAPRARACKKWQAKAENRLKIAVHRQVKKALAIGLLKKQPCTRCGSDRSQGHHEDYSKPLEVIWLCALHHAERHREIRKQKS